MKTHEDLYRQEATSMLRDITMYQALRKEQFVALYPGKQQAIEKLLTYLVRQSRIQWDSEKQVYRCMEAKDDIDPGMAAAVWVLIDFINHVDFHSVSDYPTKIIFFAEECIFEIIYVDSGKEALINSLLVSTGDSPSRYLVIVENEEQIQLLKIPNVVAYCTVSPSGEVQYYQEE